MAGIIREACVEGYEQAVRAERLGADRVELCARLDLDGLTPDAHTIEQVSEKLDIPVRVMIRPRAGGFCYSEEELQQMMDSIALCREHDVEGVVFGTLTSKKEVDLSQVRKLVEAAGPLKTVFHRAIESTSHIADSLSLLVQETAIDAILLSGTGGGKALDHVAELKELLSLVKDRELVVCGKVTKDNLSELHQQVGAKAYHGKLIVGELIKQPNEPIN